MFNAFILQRALIVQLLVRDVESRYRGSVLGLFWSLLTPILLVAVFTFVFRFVFQARWDIQLGGGTTTVSFAMMLFSGLLVHAMLGDVLTRAPSIVTEHVNFVKKVVFPLEAFGWVIVGSALFNFLAGFELLLGLVVFELGRIPPTAFFLPLILLPYLAVLVGLVWFLSSLGVYLRDIRQVTGTLTTLLLFLSPVLYPLSRLPEGMQQLLLINPISLVVVQLRVVLIEGQVPDFVALGWYWLVALVVLSTGYLCFKRLRPGFSDVL